MRCKNCGAEIVPKSKFCSSCGSTVQQEQPVKKSSGRVTLILAVLLAVMTAATAVFGVLLISGRDGAKRPAVDRETDRKVELAISALKEEWEDIFRKMDDTDGYLEIKNTRIHAIEPGTDEVLFADVAYVVEFILYSDYFGSAPYYHSGVGFDCVLIYEDGSCKVPGSNVFRTYSARTYSYDYSELIEETEDLGDRYNRVFELD